MSRPREGRRLRVCRRRHAGNNVRMTDHHVLNRRALRLLPGVLAVGMSAFVALVVTALNTGVDAHLAMRWLHAWTPACPAAIVAAYAWRPVAWRIALALARIG